MSNILTVYTLNWLCVGVALTILFRKLIFGVSTERQRITVYSDPSEWGGYPDEQKGRLWLIKDNLKQLDVLALTIYITVIALLPTAYFMAIEYLLGVL